VSIRPRLSLGLGVLGAVLWAALPPGDTQAITLFVLGLGLLLGFGAGRDEPGEGWVVTPGRIVILAFVLRAAWALVEHRYAPLSEVYAWDVPYYDTVAGAVAAAWRARIRAPLLWGVNVTVHSYLGAVVYLLVGRTLLGLGMLAALLGALSIGHVYQAARGILGSERARLVALALAVWPSHVLWTSQYLREPWVFYFVALALHASVRWRRSHALGDWLKTAACIVAVALFRTSTGLIACGALAAATAWALAVPARRPVKIERPILAALALAGGAVVALKIAASAFLGGSVLRYLALKREGTSSGPGVIHPGWGLRSWGEAIAYAPLGVVTFVIAPFPWQVRNLAQLAAALENLVLLAMMILAGARPSRLRSLDWGAAAFTVAFGALGILAFGLIEGNAGIAFRHKTQFLPSMLIVLAAAWPVARTRRA
jgi:hypothetical protein